MPAAAPAGKTWIWDPRRRKSRRGWRRPSRHDSGLAIGSSLSQGLWVQGSQNTKKRALPMTPPPPISSCTLRFLFQAGIHRHTLGPSGGRRDNNLVTSQCGTGFLMLGAPLDPWCASRELVLRSQTREPNQTTARAAENWRANQNPRDHQGATPWPQLYLPHRPTEWAQGGTFSRSVLC
jgi:hypothetical protein